MENGQHDLKTFREALVDYFECHDLPIPDVLGKMIARHCFEPAYDFQKLCALQYGKYALIGIQCSETPVREILFLDLPQKCVRRFPIAR